VFRRRELPGNVPDAAVLLLVDCSLSMNNLVFLPGGGETTRLALAVRAAAVLHEACVALKVPHCVFGFYSRHPFTWFHRAVEWGGRDGSALASLRAAGANRDGYALRAAGRDLMSRPEPRKVLIMLSDGLPADDVDRRYWPDTQGPPDTARAVRELERRGISVVGLYFGPEEGLKQARAMYNRLVYAPFPEHLPVLLGRVLREVLAPAV
jgi:nitric oxide reductase activation protein